MRLTRPRLGGGGDESAADAGEGVGEGGLEGGGGEAELGEDGGLHDGGHAVDDGPDEEGVELEVGAAVAFHVGDAVEEDGERLAGFFHHGGVFARVRQGGAEEEAIFEGMFGGELEIGMAHAGHVVAGGIAAGAIFEMLGELGVGLADEFGEEVVA